MSDTEYPMTDVPLAVFQTQAERMCQLAAAVLVLYEWMVTFDYEVEYFWKKRWSVGKALFLWSRYYGLGYNISNQFIWLQSHPTLNTCMKFFRWQDSGAILQILTTHSILELRLFAMYKQSRPLLIFFGFLMLAEIAGAVVMFQYPFPGIIVTNEPAPGVFMCADADPRGQHFIAYFPLQSLITEALLLGLALWQAWLTWKAKQGGVIEIMTRDSIKYFVVIFSIYLACFITWMINNITTNETMTGFFLAVSCVLANRLMIHIRRLYYEQDVVISGSQKPSVIKKSTMAPMEFGAPPLGSKGTGTGSGSDTMQLSDLTASTTDVESGTGRVAEVGMRSIVYAPRTTVDEMEMATFNERFGY